MKYKPEELEILKTQGKKALTKYRESNRISLGRMPNRVIESKKYKLKWKKRREENEQLLY